MARTVTPTGISLRLLNALRAGPLTSDQIDGRLELGYLKSSLSAARAAGWVVTTDDWSPEGVSTYALTPLGRAVLPSRRALAAQVPA